MSEITTSGQIRVRPDRETWTWAAISNDMVQVGIGEGFESEEAALEEARSQYPEDAWPLGD